MRRIGIVQTTPTVRRSADRAAHSPPHLSLVVSGFFSVPIPIPLGHGIFFRFPRESLFLGFLQFSSCSCDLFWVSSRILQVVSRFSSARLYFPLSAVSFDRSFWFLDLFTSLVEFFSVFFSLHLISFGVSSGSPSSLVLPLLSSPFLLFIAVEISLGSFSIQSSSEWWGFFRFIFLFCDLLSSSLCHLFFLLFLLIGASCSWDFFGFVLEYFGSSSPRLVYNSFWSKLPVLGISLGFLLRSFPLCSLGACFGTRFV